MNSKLWEPSAERAGNSLLARFIAEHTPHDVAESCDYEKVWEWSVESPEAFWHAVWKFCDVIGDAGETAFRSAKDPIDARFFPSARLNFAENLLSRRLETISFHGEDLTTRHMEGEDFKSLVMQIQCGLQAAGVAKGDRVAAIAPNTPETLAAMIATASLGAVWSSCSPDFGVDAIADRFRQIAPKLVFCTDGYFYGGHWFATLSAAKEIREQLPSQPKLVVLPYHGVDASVPETGDALPLEKFLARPDTPPVFTRFDFRHPVFILFSSGTTGLPKCICHSAGGTLLQHMKEHQLHCDIKPGDRLMFFSTCGWMMWNWVASALASGAALTLYDGSPFSPSASRLVDIAESDSLTHFGASAKYFDACAKACLKPAISHQLPDLRVVLSTGSPLSPATFDYIYSDWKHDVCLSSISGGTDIIGCFAGGSPIDAVYRGQCQKRLLGMNVLIFDDEGESVTGQAGELVCASPHPSMPIGFVGDTNDEKYRAAYYSVYPDVWRHGDWAELTREGGIEFQGRSDATLNPGGVRIGTAEIYRPVEQIEEILEALAVGRDIGADTEVVLFVRLRDGLAMSSSLDRRIRDAIRKNASPRHVPAEIIDVPDLPRTRSGKICEIAVRDVLNGRKVANAGVIANPESLDFFSRLQDRAG